MKTIRACGAMALAASLGIALCSRPVESQDSRPAPATHVKIKALLVERRDTLRQLLEAVTVRHQQGHIAINEVIHAQHDLLDAELHLAAEKAHRIRIYELRLENARNLEEAVGQQYAAGKAQIDQVLAARAARLQAEIELLSERGTSG